MELLLTLFKKYSRHIALLRRLQDCALTCRIITESLILVSATCTCIMAYLLFDMGVQCQNWRHYFDLRTLICITTIHIFIPVYL